MIAVDLSKQQVLDADPKTIQRINFTGDSKQDEDEVKLLGFSQRTVNEKMLFCFSMISV